MTDKADNRFIEIYNLITDGLESLEIAYCMVVKNNSSDIDEATASTFINRAISKFTSAETLYTVFSDHLKGSNLFNVFNLFHEFESEFLKSLVNRDTYENLPEVYEKLKNAIEQY